MVPMAHEAGAILVEAAGAGAGKRPLVLRLAAEIRAFFGNVAPREQLGRVGRNLEARDVGLRVGDLRRGRSEEHTSELQSLMRISYAVFCLKKKKRYNKVV